MSKGVGFVRFDQHTEAEQAINKLNNQIHENIAEPLVVKVEIKIVKMRNFFGQKIICKKIVCQFADKHQISDGYATSAVRTHLPRLLPTL